MASRSRINLNELKQLCNAVQDPEKYFELLEHIGIKYSL